MTNLAINVTRPPKHHFFGFHDISAWNFNGDKILSLEVENITRPPLPGETANVGFIEKDHNFIKIGETSAFNYPQGSRMQWIANSNNFIVNNKMENYWGSNIYDTDSRKLIEEIPFSCYCMKNDGIACFTINFARLNRLGAYGYPGVDDITFNEPVPQKDGIYIGNILTKKKSLLISIHEVANYPRKVAIRNNCHHYITHLVLNPSNSRLAFLHRFTIPDGGEITRLMTIGVDGSNLRCLATGFLSHFDWKDDQCIFIYGRANSNIDSLRSNSLFSLPVLSVLVKVSKKAIKLFYKKGTVLNSSFLLINDENNGFALPVAKNVIVSDGHPMFNPLNRDWVINDTYPNEIGVRTLMLYQFSNNKRIDLGEFKMIDVQPDMKLINIFFQGVDSEVLKSIGVKNLTFTRSGLHCDLHPRWDRQGNKIAFDSIHDGTRQIYVVDVSNIIKA